MALIQSKLKADLSALYSDMREREDICDDEFAERLAGIIDLYIKSATITVPAGIAVSTAGSPTAQTGATTAPATAIIS